MGGEMRKRAFNPISTQFRSSFIIILNECCCEIGLIYPLFYSCRVGHLVVGLGCLDAYYGMVNHFVHYLCLLSK